MKKSYIYILLAVFFGLYLLYLNSTAENIIYMDQIRMTELINKYFNGTLSFSDLWASYLGHRGLGYHLIFLLNAIFFNLNTLLEINLSAICLLFIAIIIIKSYFNSINKLSTNNNNMIVSVSLVSILMVVFSLNKWETALLGLGLNEYIPHVLFLIMFYIFNLFLLNNNISKKNKFMLFIALNISIFFYSLAYLVPFFVAIYLIFIFDLFVKNKRDNINLKIRIIALFTINTIILCFIYFYNINSNINESAKLSIIERIKPIISQPLDIIMFYLYGITGSVLGAETGSILFNNELLLMIGIIIFGLYILSMYLFLKLKIYKNTYVPILLIFYSLVYMALVVVGRIDYGVMYGMQSRYALAMMYGIIGIIWILTLSIKLTSTKSKILIPSYILVLVFILICIMLTTIDEVKKSPYREEAYQNMRTDAYFMNMSNWQQYQSTQDLTVEAFSILKKYNLNVFYDYEKKELKELGSNIHQANLKNGIYVEDQKYWLSKTASIKIKSGPTGKAILNGYMTNVLETNRIKIFEDGKEIYNMDLKPGQINFEFNVEPNKVLNLEFELEKTYIPSKIGLGNDERELGILVNELYIK